jgi:imidazolonepropionase-like amidohydrolase
MIVVLVAILLTTPLAALAEVPSALAIRGARVVTVSGPILDKGTVVIRDGLIEAVGADVSPPADAWVIDGAGLTVYPGLIDALSSYGLPKEGEKKEESGPPPESPLDRPMTTSWICAADLVQPSDKALAEARRAGFTTAVVFPQNGIFGGQGAAVNLAGKRPGDMVIAPSVGQYVALATSGSRAFPASLMGTIAYIRQVYLDADRYREAKAVYAANPVGLKRPAYDRALEGVLASDRVLLPAPRAMDVRRMLRLAGDLNRAPVLYGLHEGYAAIDEIREAKVPVLVSLKWPAREKDADPAAEDPLRVLELREKAPSTPRMLAEADIRFAFYSGGVEKPADAVKAVRKAIDAGLAQEDAVCAMTLGPAEIYGLDDRLGSIEAGKIANLLVTDGELFEENTKVKHVFVDGAKFTIPEAPPEDEKEEKKS